MVLKERDVQTKIKHEILEKYLGAWVGIILNGIRRQNKSNNIPSVKFIYADLFAYRGFYDFDTTKSLSEYGSLVKGSPLIGIDCLKKAVKQGYDYKVDVSYNCIFIEEVKENYDDLVSTLGDYQNIKPGKINETVKFEKLQNQDISVINGNCLEYIDKILQYLEDRHTWGFIFIDPYGAKSIPMDMVSKFVNAKNVDCMINFPILDVYRKAGNIDNLKTIVRNSGQEQMLHNIDAAYGNSEWRDVKNHMLSPALKDKTKIIENFIGEHYYKSLSKKCINANIKRIPVNFSDKSRIMFDLLLTTKDPNGALVMNDILRKANVSQDYHSQIAKIRKTVRKEQNSDQISFFTSGEEFKNPNTIVKPNVYIYSKEQVGKWLLSQLKNQRIKLIDIYRRCVNQPFNRNEILKGLKHLKSINKVTYNSITNKYNTVDFLE